MYFRKPIGNSVRPVPPASSGVASCAKAVIQATVHRWTVHYAPLLLERFNRRKRPVSPVGGISTNIYQGPRPMALSVLRHRNCAHDARGTGEVRLHPAIVSRGAVRAARRISRHEPHSNLSVRRQKLRQSHCAKARSAFENPVRGSTGFEERHLSAVADPHSDRRTRQPSSWDDLWRRQALPQRL